MAQDRQAQPGQGPQPGHPDTHALAAIRPGDPVGKLARAIGDRWRAPRPEEAGWIHYLDEEYRVIVRLDAQSRVGAIWYELNFDPSARIEGIHLGMSEDRVPRALPGLKLTAIQQTSPYRFGVMPLDGGASLLVQISHGRVISISATNPDAVWPERPLPLPRPRTSFDVTVVEGLRPPGTAAPEGWCFGLPRGIAPTQWPLSAKTGFPLEHHFTIRVPEPYRVKGAEHVALAVFSDTVGESPEAPAIARLMTRLEDGRGLPDSVAPDLQPFLRQLRARHPMEFRCKDVLHSSLAFIWLTEAEFAGAECPPPEPIVTPANGMCALPDWLRLSAAERLFGWDGAEAFNPDHVLHQLAGARPQDRWEILLLRTRPVTDDPNTGKIPVEFFDGDNPDSYVPRYSEEWDALPARPGYGMLHFGGTASPAQAMPDLTPFYLEFDETAGMFNFGGGNAQLDLVTMKLDWAQ